MVFREIIGVLPRLLSCIRFDEVLVLQGAPIFGLCFALGKRDLSVLTTIAAVLVGNTFLVAHVFVLNDWAGIEGDKRDPRRASRTFLAKGTSRKEVFSFAMALLALSLMVLSRSDVAAVWFALAIAAMSAVYSAPGLHAKGMPVVNSALHVAGGIAHFLLGYVTLAPLSFRAVSIGCYFGLVFAAGHLTHEARDHGGDLLNGIRTNAVAFGKERAVIASLAIFSIAYVLLIGLALADIVPRPLAGIGFLYPLHLLAVRQALRRQFSFESLRLLQACYRIIHAAIGLLMAASTIA